MIFDKNFLKKLYQFIHYAKKNGYISIEEIKIFFEDFNITDTQLEGICNIFSDIGISVLNKESNEIIINLDENLSENEDLNNKEIVDIIDKDKELLSDNTMKLFLWEIGKFPLLTAEQELELAKQASNGDKYAKELLILSNMKLVVNIAKKYQSKGVPLSDLISYGYFGLKKAIEKYDYTKGYKISTYATWWIRQAITRAIGDEGRSVRLPIHIIEILNKYNRAFMDLFVQKEKIPTDEEIANYLNIDIQKINEIKKYVQDNQSINNNISNNDNDTENDYIVSENNDVLDSTINNIDLRNTLEEILKTLTPKEAEILKVRYGLIDGKPKTLEETGKIFNITKERVRQIETKALRKLKHPSKSLKLKDFLN